MMWYNNLFCTLTVLLLAIHVDTFPMHIQQLPPTITEWIDQVITPKELSHLVYRYTRPTLSLVMESPEHANQNTLNGIAAFIKRQFKNVSCSNLNTLAELWAPLEYVIETWAPDAHVACALIQYDTVWCIVRGQCNLLVCTSDTCISPAKADILNWHTYEPIVSADNKSERSVPLFGCSSWRPGYTLCLYTPAIGEHVTTHMIQRSINISSRCSSSAQSLTDDILVQCLNTNKKSPFFKKNAALCIVKNKLTDFPVFYQPETPDNIDAPL